MRRIAQGDGVEDLPFKLIITSIILAVILPLGWGAFAAYDRMTLSEEVDARMAAFEGLLRSMSASPGSVREFDLDLTGGSVSDVDYVRIGGALGSGFDQLAEYSVEGSRVRLTLEDVRVCSAQNGTLELAAGSHSLVLESKSDWTGRTYIEVRTSGG